ncbi:2-oxo acid dehydrogenase subunit E2 [Haladaptatus sp. DYSN1]|uniref:2-oxo acid dehydrogenase subunit E2 n=1 Tax=unclassified Haladaptatus TaxID=2622732 RepID=UPI002407552B|nr:2-oxo acid dehydrogenase subunit E2 [Haladaptatus sp. DYSN1]
MVYEFKLPDVGEGLTEAEIVNWLVSEGDEVTEDMPVAEAETDKAVVEIPSPVNGTVKEILAEAGEMVPVGNVIITFNVEGEEPAEEETEAAEPAAEAEAEPEADKSAANGESSAKGGRIFAAPSARRLARELGVDIGSVAGSGPSGRVTEQDVRAAAEGGDDGAQAAAEPAAESDAEEPAPAPETTESAGSGGTQQASVSMQKADRDRTLAAPATRKLAADLGVDLNAVPEVEQREGQSFVTADAVQQFAEAQTEAQQADVAALGTTSKEDERVPYRGIRRTIGRQMEKSKYTAPHVTHHDEIDVTELVETRADLKEEAEKRGVKLTYMPFVMKAVVAGLKEFPYMNSMLDEDAEEIVLKKDYNIGIAVATDAGLMVPVVKGVDQKGMLQISTDMNELVGKARDRSIERSDMQGGTFTITNFGAIGGEYATPIINVPEVAILGLGAIKEKPRVVDGEVVPRHVMTISLSIDHRIIDGAVAAQFANTVKNYLENPALLLLE